MPDAQLTAFAYVLSKAPPESFFQIIPLYPEPSWSKYSMPVDRGYFLANRNEDCLPKAPESKKAASWPYDSVTEVDAEFGKYLSSAFWR